MEQDKISFHQLMALFWAGIMGPAAELLPAVTTGIAGPAGWLSTVLALPILLCACWIIARLTRQGGSLADGIVRALGPAAGKGVLFLYIVWMEGVLVLRLRLSAQRLLSAGERDGALWFFLFALAALGLWLASGKLAALSRAAELFFAVLMAGAAAVIGLALFQVKPENLLPVWTQDLGPALYSALPGAGVLGYGLFAAFLWGQVAQPGPGRRWLRWGVGGCLALSVAQLVILGAFGPALTARLKSPFFQLAQSVGVDGAFQRVESVITAIWVFSDLALLAGLLWGMRILCHTVFGARDPRVVNVTALLPAVVVALAAFSGKLAAESLGRSVVLVGNLFMGLALPALVLAIATLRGARKGDHISCGQNMEKTEDVGPESQMPKNIEKTKKRC